MALVGWVRGCPLESLPSQQGRLYSKTKEGRRSVCPLEIVHCRVFFSLGQGQGFGPFWGLFHNPVGWQMGLAEI